MFIGDTLIEEVALNYNGLSGAEEIGWYHQGLVQYLCEQYEPLLQEQEAAPVFRIEKTRFGAAVPVIKKAG